MELGYRNPLSEGLGLRRSAEPCTAVIFGASGDLTKRKLIPALYSLARKNLLAPGFSVVGAGRTAMTHERFRGLMREANRQFTDAGLVHDIAWQDFAAGLFYNTTDKSAESYERLGELLAQIDRERGTQSNRLFYLATPPSMFGEIVRQLGERKMNRPAGGSWVRIVVEKPFGLDLASARDLNRELLAVFDEEQVYRIDHYLGKETVQNIMVLRFANGIFEPVWNRHYIDHVQITAAESIGVESRGEYYEQAGALRDMVQNHMMQLLAMVAMEPPVTLDADAIRNEKVKVMQAVRPFSAGDAAKRAARGQYGASDFGGRPIRGYRQENNIDPDSLTETYAAVKLFVDNWRWANVPFYLRSGKRLPKRVTEIAIQFKNAPHLLFDGEAGRFASNTLVLRIQPDEGIAFSFNSKAPGQFIDIRPVSMDFEYTASFGKKSPEAYARLLLDAMLGDSTLYARKDMVEKTWEIFMPLLEEWQRPITTMPVYAPGSWGPPGADELLERDGRQWRQP
jgi:glucose-6-phosphate 1-dehydrogenase